MFPGEATRMSQRAGVPPEQGDSILAQILPQLIDRLTPQGRVPQQDQTSALLRSLLR
jgi:uncharacterized protein YidB (DUF937 family)